MIMVYEIKRSEKITLNTMHIIKELFLLLTDDFI